MKGVWREFKNAGAEEQKAHDPCLTVLEHKAGFRVFGHKYTQKFVQAASRSNLSPNPLLHCELTSEFVTVEWLSDTATFILQRMAFA